MKVTFTRKQIENLVKFLKSETYYLDETSLFEDALLGMSLGERSEELSIRRAAISLASKIGQADDLR